MKVQLRGARCRAGGSPTPRDQQRLGRRQVPPPRLAAAPGSPSHRTASSRGYWREGQSYLWPGKEGGKVRGFPVQLQFSPSREEV